MKPSTIVTLLIGLIAGALLTTALATSLVTGLRVGAVATTGLDIIRLPGTFFGCLAHDEARMAGEMILMTEAHGHGREDAMPEGKQGAHGSAPTDEHTGAAGPGGPKDAHGESKEHAPDAASLSPA